MIKEKQPTKIEKEKEFETLVRIAEYDIPAGKNVYCGLNRIKGVSWSISNAICVRLGIPKDKKIGDLTKEEILKIESFLKNLDVPDYLKNRRFDFETGKTTHLIGSEIDITKEFDIKRLKKIKSWRGFRHSYGQPVRGQRTKSHFRKKGQVVGVRRKT